VVERSLKNVKIKAAQRLHIAFISANGRKIAQSTHSTGHPGFPVKVLKACRL
jgi:hypothetical protein